MKKVLLMFCLLLSFNLMAESRIPIPITGISATEFEAMFKLETDITPLKVILDCQSFLHGINIYQQATDGTFQKSLEFYLEQPECLEIYEFVRNQSDQNKESCIVLDTETLNYQLFSSCEDARDNI